MADREKVINHFDDALSKIAPADWWVSVRKDFVTDAIVLLKEQETMMQCIKGKCRICPHCANCDVDENGLLKEQEAVVPLTIDDSVSEIMNKHYKRLKEQEEIELCDRCGRRRIKSSRQVTN